MPGPGFKAMPPEEHHRVSSKGGKTTWRRRCIRMHLVNATSPMSMSERGHRGGKMSAFSRRLVRVERMLAEMRP